MLRKSVKLAVRYSALCFLLNGTANASSEGDINYEDLLKRCTSQTGDMQADQLDDTCKDYRGIFDQVFKEWPMVRLIKNLSNIYKKSNLLYFGTHKCMSATSIGHACQVYGYFLTLHEANFTLNRHDCCPDTPEGGASVEFFTNGPNAISDKARLMFDSQPLITRP